MYIVVPIVTSMNVSYITCLRQTCAYAIDLHQEFMSPPKAGEESIPHAINNGYVKIFISVA